ncbi:MAG: nitroreductase family protein [Clostridiales bacterium]|nr:MAG: nitroreductase family protein [Clostridiales bacterium]
MTTTETIRKRRSVRKYRSDEKIPQKDIQLILEAAMMAPSACNSRPWEFIVINSDEMKQQITQIHPYAKHLKDAAIGILVCGLPDLQQGKSEGFWPQDCAAATQNILLQATELGYGTCWCGVYPKTNLTESFQKLLNITSMPVSLITIGVSEDEPAPRGFYDETKVKSI